MPRQVPAATWSGARWLEHRRGLVGPALAILAPVGLVHALFQGGAGHRSRSDRQALTTEMQRGPGIAAEPVVPAAARAEVGTDKDAAVIGDHPDDGLCRRLAVLGCRFDPNLGLPAQPGQVSRRKDFHGSEMKSSISRQALPNALSLRTAS